MSTDLFKHLRKCGDDVGERLDCSVISLAVIMNCSYGAAHQRLAEQGRKRRKRVLGSVIEAVLVNHGFNVGPVEYTARTALTIERELTEGKYLVYVTNGDHVFALVDGVIHDWARKRRKRISSVWKITKNENSISDCTA